MAKLKVRLNHRVRNTLQVVTAVAAQTLREEPAPTAFVRTFLDRLRALGVAHDLVSRGGWSDVPLHDLMAMELKPYATAQDRVSAEGPPLRVSAKAAVALGMAVHELATNAAKHGALSAAGGRVAITWSVEGEAPDSRLLLRWREEGGPPMQSPVRRGFGSKLIERQVRHDLRGDIEVEFHEQGLRAALTIPLPPRPIASESEGASK